MPLVIVALSPATSVDEYLRVNPIRKPLPPPYFWKLPFNPAVGSLPYGIPHRAYLTLPGVAPIPQPAFPLHLTIHPSLVTLGRALPPPADPFLF